MRWIGKSHNSFTPLCHYIKHPKNRSISTRNERENEWIRMSEEMNKERNIVLSLETITNLIDSMRQLSKVFPFKTFIWGGEYESVMRMKWRRMNGVSESEYECEWEYDKNEVSVMRMRWVRVSMNEWDTCKIHDKWWINSTYQQLPQLMIQQYSIPSLIPF